MSEATVKLECDGCGADIEVEYELDPYGAVYVDCETCGETNTFSMEDLHAAFVAENECDCEVCRENAQMENLMDLRRGL